MPEAKEGLLSGILKSVEEEKLSPEDAWDFFCKMGLEKGKVLAILVSLSTQKITILEAKEKITSLVAHKRQHKCPA